MPKCKIHPLVELRYGFVSHKTDWCWACCEERELEWGLENPKDAFKKWNYEIKIAKEEKKFAQVEAIQKRIRTLKRTK